MPIYHRWPCSTIKSSQLKRDTKYFEFMSNSYTPLWLMITSYSSWYPHMYLWCMFFYFIMTSDKFYNMLSNLIVNWSQSISYIFNFPFPLPLITVKTSFYFHTPLEQKFVFLAYLLPFSINPIISSKFLYLTILPLRKPNIILYIHIEKKLFANTLAKPKDKCRSIFVAKHYILGTTNFLVHYVMYVFEYIKHKYVVHINKA